MNEQVCKVLERLEMTNKEFWNVPRSTAEFLVKMVRDVGSTLNVEPTSNVNVLEIGTSNGYSGIWFASFLQELSGRGKLVTIESNAKRFEMARKNFEEAGVTEFVEQVQGHAPEIFESDRFRNLRNFFDLVFIDSTKMEYRSYLDYVLPMLRKGGVLIADNCISHREELDEFFAELESRTDLKKSLIDIDNGLMVVTGL